MAMQEAKKKSEKMPFRKVFFEIKEGKNAKNEKTKNIY